MTRRTIVRSLGAAGLVAVVVQAACSKDSVEEARKRAAAAETGSGPKPTGEAQGSAEGGAPGMAGGSPHGGMPGMVGGSPHGDMPALGGSFGSNTEPTDGNALPLKLTGLGSAAELQRELGKLNRKADAATFERAFRLTFTTDKMKRGYSEASELLTPFTAANPRFAAAYRTLAYAKFNMNITQPDEPLELYDKSVQIDPQYGEAHYAIAFLYTLVDPQKGVEHFKKAMALGVPDERNIGPNFYPHALETQ